jgi:hypothetical protein
MANTKPKTAEPVSASELRAYAEQLDAFLHLIRKAEAETLKQPSQELFTYGLASGKAGIDRLRTFVQQLDVSRYQASIGHPIKKGEKRNKRNQDDENE